MTEKRVRYGRPPLPEGERRIKQNLYFDPKTRELARKILAARLPYFQEASGQNSPGWGHVVDEAVRRLAEELGLSFK